MATNNFGFWTLTFLVVANMVGAGVFTTSGFSLGELGSPHLVVIAWIVGGVVALSGAVSYGLLIKAMPESGGEYLFLSRAVHPLIGFIAGWVSLIAGFSGAIAFTALALEAYVVPARIRPTFIPKGSFAICTIVLAGMLHGLRPRLGALVQNGVVIVKLVLLMFVILFAVTQLQYWEGLAEAQPTRRGWEAVPAFATSLVWISLSYSGFNAAVYIASEAENARHIVPRSLVAGTVVVFTIYVSLNAVFVYSTNPAMIIFKEDVAAIAANSLGGAWLESILRTTIAACLFTSVFSMMMASPRVYAKMAEDRLMPKQLCFHGASPMAATFVQMAFASAIVLISRLQDLLSYLGLTLSLCSACTVACVLLPKIRTRQIYHPMHLFPITYVSSTLSAGVIMAATKPWQIAWVGLTLLAGTVAYNTTKRSVDG